MWDNMELIWKQNTGEQFDQAFMVCSYTLQQAFLYNCHAFLKMAV